ncbi:hypothetical protein FGO68_gene2386 [Halteria grandinella]|uniref:Uncharacterized protein n=1 Tax=Halteria grandinella TaxID=5974 RepID=A0A8J8P6U6_HALGN|nr:hypothetical protein FGO68_gene2386 [Halteria grandinella]
MAGQVPRGHLLTQVFWQRKQSQMQIKQLMLSKSRKQFGSFELFSASHVSNQIKTFNLIDTQKFSPSPTYQYWQGKKAASDSETGLATSIKQQFKSNSYLHAQMTQYIHVYDSHISSIHPGTRISSSPDCL